MSSIFSPLSTAWASVSGHAGSAAGSTRDNDLHARVAPVGVHHARRELVTAAVEHGHHVAGAQPQHSRQVLGLVVRQRDGLVAGIEVRCEEPVHGGHYGGHYTVQP